MKARAWSPFIALTIFVAASQLSCGQHKRRSDQYLRLSGNMPQVEALAMAKALSHRFQVLILLPSQGCPCHWNLALAGIVQALGKERIDAALHVVISDGAAGARREALTAGAQESALMDDLDGEFCRKLGLSGGDLPYWMVFDTLGGGQLVMGARISPVGNEQALAGAMLATLHSFPGGQLP